MKNKDQLNLYFDEGSFQKKENKNLDVRINIIISVFLIFSFLTVSKLFALGMDKKNFFFMKLIYPNQ
jgi:hypothetical protein